MITGSERNISTITTNTRIRQLETLEAIISKLADHLDIPIIHKRLSARGATFYSTGNERGPYQSATNTILALVNKL